MCVSYLIYIAHKGIEAPSIGILVQRVQLAEARKNIKDLIGV